MTYVKWHIDYTPFKNETWSYTDTVALTKFYDPIMSVKLGEGRDSFNMKVTNFTGTYDNYFNPNDKLEIYRSVNTDVKPADPIMIITLKDTPEEYTANSNFIRVEGYNYSEAVLSAIVFIDVEDRTIPQAFQDALTDAGQDNPNFQVGWSSSSSTTKKDGTVFPTVKQKWFYKPIRKLLEEYSQSVRTEDGNYYWYVDNSNELVWKPASGSKGFNTGTFDYSTDATRSMKLSKDIKGIRNYFILKGGLDPEGHQITSPYVNWTSVATNGRKYMIVADANTQNTAKQLVDQDIGKDIPIEDKQSFADNYPSAISAGTSFTTSWVARGTYTTKKENISVTAGSNVTINTGTASGNKRAYVEVIRTEVKYRLKEQGQDMAENLQYGKLKVDLEFPPDTKSWGIGDVITCNIATINNNDPTEMRVNEIQYTTDADIYSLVEDIGTIGR